MNSVCWSVQKKPRSREFKPKFSEWLFQDLVDSLQQIKFGMTNRTDSNRSNPADCRFLMAFFAHSFNGFRKPKPKPVLCALFLKSSFISLSLSLSWNFLCTFFDGFPKPKPEPKPKPKPVPFQCNNVCFPLIILLLFNVRPAVLLFHCVRRRRQRVGLPGSSRSNADADGGRNRTLRVGNTTTTRRTWVGKTKQVEAQKIKNKKG